MYVPALLLILNIHCLLMDENAAVILLPRYVFVTSQVYQSVNLNFICKFIFGILYIYIIICTLY